VVENTIKSQNFNEDALFKEYYEIVRIVGEFDGRLMTVKGWGVTLSLAALGWGFQYSHYGLFLVAALSGLGFWLIEAQIKRHQMRHYVRMRQIEALQYKLADEDLKKFSSPRIDSSWSYAGKLYVGKIDPEFKPREFSGRRTPYLLVWLFPHVFLPHAVTLLSGVILLWLGLSGSLGEMKW
jgi:uncharacterized membrane protein